MKTIFDWAPIFAIFAIFAGALFVIMDKPLEMQCEGRGWTMITTTDELAKPVVIGIVNGKEVAMSRDSILKCRRVP